MAKSDQDKTIVDTIQNSTATGNTNNTSTGTSSGTSTAQQVGTQQGQTQGTQQAQTFQQALEQMFGTSQSTATGSTTGVTTGAQTGTSQQVQTGQVGTNSQSGPLDAQAQYYKQLWDAASKSFGATNGQTYNGNLVAAPNAMQTGALQNITSVAPQLSAGAAPLQQYGMGVLNGNWLSPDTNPYIKDVATAAIAPAQQQFEKNKLAIGDRAIAQGAYGGSRQDLQELEALDSFNKSALNTTSNIYANNYAQERGYQQQAGQLLDQSNILALAGPNAQLNAGNTQQGWDQAALAGDLQKWQMGQAAPWAGMNELAAILGAGGFGSQTGTQTQQGQTVGTSGATSTGTQTGTSQQQQTGQTSSQGSSMNTGNTLQSSQGSNSGVTTGNSIGTNTGTSTGVNTGTTSSVSDMTGKNTETPPPGNPLLGILQGILGGGVTGANLATGIGGVAAGAGMGAFAPWLLPIAALGGLMGAL